MNNVTIIQLFFLRFFNLMSIVLSYIYSVLFKKVKVAPMPFSINIEPTNKCQLSCPECPTGMNQIPVNKGEMNLNVFEKLISSIYKQVFYINLYFQGEPLLNKHIIDMIKLARKHRMYVVLSTNAQIIDEKRAEELVLSGLSKIIVSMDGITNSSYQKYRVGGQLTKVKDAIVLLNKAKQQYRKNKLRIVAQFLVNRYNEHEISEFLQWAKNNKVKPTLKSMQLYSDFTFLPQNEKFRRYSFVNNNWVLKRSKKNRCFRIWKQCVIRYNGDVLPCCFDKYAQYVVGNINEENLSNIWLSEKFTSFRYNILMNKNSVLMCTNCKE